MELSISSHQRSKKVIMTDEARVLKRLRLERGLSLREVAENIGKNHSTIAHIEGGRMDVPSGSRLMGLLAVYGVESHRSFTDRVRNYRERATPRDELNCRCLRLRGDRVGLYSLHVAGT